MSVEELVKRLREKQMRLHDLSGVGYMDDPDCQESADKLEELAAENERLKRERDAMREKAISNARERNKAEAALAEAKQEIAALRGALEMMLEPYERDPCWHDHHGYCQAHFLQEDCCVAEAHKVLARNAGGNDARST